MSKLNLVSYMDETGHSDDPALDYVGMAGFVAPLGSWEVFDAGWKDLMHNAGLREPFHMKDFAHSQGQFRQWRENEPLRRALFGSAMKLIVETGATPIGALVSLSGFRSLTQAQQKSFLDPYYLVFQTVTRGAAIEAVFEDDPEEKVAMIYLHHPEYGTDAGRAEQLWHAIKGHYEHGNRMASYKSASPSDVSPLQAADIFAYELSHEFENRIKRPAAEMRWGLRQIVAMYRIPSPQILFFDRKELLRRIKESRWPDQTGVQEVASNQEQSAQESMMKWLIERGHFEREHFEGFFEAMNAIVGQKLDD